MITRARVKFEKVKKDYFLKNRYTAFDMHFHTAYSDGKVNIPQLVKKIERLNIGVAITDHNEIKGAIEISKYENIKSIPGIEMGRRRRASPVAPRPRGASSGTPARTPVPAGARPRARTRRRRRSSSATRAG